MQQRTQSAAGGDRGLGGRCSRLGGGARANHDLSEQRADRDGFAVLGNDIGRACPLTAPGLRS